MNYNMWRLFRIIVRKIKLLRYRYDYVSEPTLTRHLIELNKRGEE